jgi:hypothetical protein
VEATELPYETELHCAPFLSPQTGSGVFCKEGEREGGREERASGERDNRTASQFVFNFLQVEAMN